jgi:rhodanese-related sulfurtransferase
VSPRSIEDLLAEARGRLERVSPAQAAEAMQRGALLVDIRSDRQRAQDGLVPGARHVPRNVLEWRVDALGRDSEVILMCDEGYQSSLAAATLQELGIARATDLDGGFQAWRAAGLPVERA